MAERLRKPYTSKDGREWNEIIINMGVVYIMAE